MHVLKTAELRIQNLQLLRIVQQNTSLALSCGIIVVGGNQVAEGDLRIGTFLILLRITSIVGESFSDAYKTYLTMHDAYLSLWRVVRYINQPTDLPKRKDANRIRRKRGEEERRIIREMMSSDNFLPGVFPADLIPIAVEEVSFKYKGSTHWLLQNVSFEIMQGTFVGIFGGASSGKGVLLELLGSVIEQESGSIFIPPHLRVLHVSRVPYVLGGSVNENLLFGLVSRAADAKLVDYNVNERMRRICTRLGFSWRLMELAETNATSPALGLPMSSMDR